MNGMLNIIMVIATVIVAVMTYQVKFRARTLELEIHALHKKNRLLKASLTVLRSERAYLSRPERIERLSRKFLKLSKTPLKRSLSYTILAAQREDWESQQAANQALMAMRLADKKKRERQKGQQKDGVGTSLGRSQGYVMGYKKALPPLKKVKAPSAEVQPEAETSPLSAPEPLKKKAVSKPKWTFTGAIGEDD